MARHNLKALTHALGQACVEAGCPGITPSESRERERGRRDDAERRKAGR